MIVTFSIDVKIGRDDRELTAEDLQINIDALRRYVKRKQKSMDDVILLDTVSLLEGMQDSLRKG